MIKSKKIDYLENLCQTNEIILLDTNILSAHCGEERSVINDIYESKESLCFDTSKVQEETEYRKEIIKIIQRYENILTTQGVYNEEKNLSEILEHATEYNNQRINMALNKNLRKSVTQRRKSKGRRFKKKDIQT